MEAFATLVNVRPERPLASLKIDRIGHPDPEGCEIAADLLDPFERPQVSRLRQACQSAGIARVVYRNPRWERHPLDRWVEVRSLQGAVDAVTSVARNAMIALPEADVFKFNSVGGLRFSVRSEAPPTLTNLPPRFQFHVVGEAVSVEAERLLLQKCKAQALITRETGALPEQKLVIAARQLDLPVILIRRPIERPEIPARSAPILLEWIVSHLTAREGSDQSLPGQELTKRTPQLPPG